MNNSQAVSSLERLADGVILQKLDDVCFVRIGERSVDAAQTRILGEKLIAYLEKAGCRKLVMSFEGVDSLYGFLIPGTPSPHTLKRFSKEPEEASTPLPIGSDIWLG
jgi:hypothetical protein